VRSLKFCDEWVFPKWAWSGSSDQFLHCGLRKSVYRWYTQLDSRRFVYDTYKTMKATRTRHGGVYMFITHRLTLTLQLHNFDLSELGTRVRDSRLESDSSLCFWDLRLALKDLRLDLRLEHKDLRLTRDSTLRTRDLLETCKSLCYSRVVIKDDLGNIFTQSGEGQKS